MPDCSNTEFTGNTKMIGSPMDLSQQILSDITVFNKYAKYIPERNRRETWAEICDRNRDMHIRKFPGLKAEIEEVYSKFIKTKKALPSMRSMQFGGAAIESNAVRLYNCAYLPVDSVKAFSETLFLLLSGTGVGYSVQQHHIAKLPPVIGNKEGVPQTFTIGDSIEGWADALHALVDSYFSGTDKIIFDYSAIRAKGTRLKTSGGRAPGPEPLRRCLDYIRDVLDGAIGRKLKSIEVHDIQCHSADAVLSGGIRRAAMISLFSPNDDDLLTSKGQIRVLNYSLTREGDNQVGWVRHSAGKTNVVLNSYDSEQLLTYGTLPWYIIAPQRGRANNSAVLDRAITTEADFFSIWKKVEESKAGEPGVYWTNDVNLGTNPCCEISLNPMQFCNLTECNVSDVVDQEDLNARVKACAFICTLQASYTNFPYLRKEWREQTEKEALIGVGMTGIGSGKVDKLDLKQAANIVKAENERVAAIIGINPAARCTTVKPSGTSSLVLGSSSGIHAWHNDYYIRRMRVGKSEPLYWYMSQVVPALIEDCKFKPETEAVMSFPQRAPKGASLRTESYVDLLERVRRFNLEWVGEGHRYGANNHNVSCTISLKDDEWHGCGRWMWDNRNNYNGIAVLPYDGGTYVQAPFEDTTEQVFHEMMQHLVTIDLTEIYEEEDVIAHEMEAACAGGVCEITV